MTFTFFSVKSNLFFFFFFEAISASNSALFMGFATVYLFLAELHGLWNSSSLTRY